MADEQLSLFQGGQFQRPEPNLNSRRRREGRVNQRTAERYPAVEQNTDVERYMAGRVPTIRADHFSAANILQDGKFRSQFETQTSNGSLDPHARREWEARHWGYEGTTPSRARPIYGYMAKADPADEDTDAEQYGDIRFHLDPGRIRHRSTVTWGDSLGSSTHPFRYDDAMAGRVPEGFTPAYRYDEAIPPDYAELQVHGGASVADIKDAHIEQPRSYFEDSDYDTLRDMLEDRGIPYKQVADGERYTQGRMFMSVLPSDGPPRRAEIPAFDPETFDSTIFKSYPWGHATHDRRTVSQWAPGMSRPIEHPKLPPVPWFLARAKREDDGT